MSVSKKLLQAAAGAAGGAGLDVDEVFSTFVADATGSGSLTINNGIDLSGEGGIVWVKSRNNAHNHYIFDTNVGSGGYLQPNNTASGLTGANYSFTSTGLTDAYNNYSGNEAVWWTFRKAPKFFDVVTYTGNDTEGRTVSHNLGSVPGMIIVKQTNGTNPWTIYHRGVDASAPEDYRMHFTSAARVNASGAWNDTAPTSTEFTLGSSTYVNGSGNTYVAYLFAHNNSDGGFGPDSDQDIIKCGSFTTDSNEDATINLGFEPQWVLYKRTDSAVGGAWNLYDIMRGLHGDFLSQAAVLVPNDSSVEDATTNRIAITPTGFKIDNYGANRSYIYMAIRRGPLAKPTDPSKVFHTSNNFFYQNFDSLGFDADFNINTRRIGTYTRYILTRMLGTTYLLTDVANAEGSGSTSRQFWDYRSNWIDLSTSWWASTSYTNFYSWRRAPGFCDVVAYTSNTTYPNTFSHNLGVVPEMIWIKRRDSGVSWAVYHSALGNTKHLTLNDTSAESASSYWNNTSPTASVVTVGGQDETWGYGSYKYVAYLFASVAGVSKVGSYTGDGSEDGSKVIDCGFSSGSQFVLIKRTDSAGGWQFFDSARGIVAGNDSRLQLDNNVQATTGYDFIDPDNSGFIVGVSTTSKNAFNVSGGNYIFYAIAN